MMITMAIILYYRQAVELLMAMSDIMKRVNEVTWPLLTICGTDDKLIEPEGCRLLHEKASSSDKTLKVSIAS